MSKANTIRILINILIGIGLIWLWLQLIDVEKVGQAFTTLNPSYFLPFFIIAVLSTVARSVRIQNILNMTRKDSNEKILTLKQLSLLNFTGQLVSFLIPLRAGEVLKTVYLSNQASVPITKSILIILFDRFFDFWSIFVIAAILLLFIDLPVISSVTWLVVLIGLGCNLPFLVAFLRPSNLDKLQILASKSPKVIRAILKLPLASLDFFYQFRRNPKYLVKVIALSLLGFSLDCLLWVMVLSAFGLTLPIDQLYLANSLSAISFLIPSAPGFVGSAEAFGQLIFGNIFGLDDHLVAAAVVTNHLWIALVLISTGIISLNLLEINLRSVWNKIKDRN